LYSLLVTTEEERITRRVVLAGDADVLVHVVDAKALARMVPLTLQLVETHKPIILAVNMMDEAERLGLQFDLELLSRRLSLPVVPIVATRGTGVPQLVEQMKRALGGKIPALPVYPNGVGHAISALRSQLQASYPAGATVYASLLLQGDEEIAEAVAEREPDAGLGARAAVTRALAQMRAPAGYRVAVERQNMADELLSGVIRRPPRRARELGEKLGHALAAPWPGIPILLLVLYLGLYKFVGQFGAGTVVDWIETGFEQRFNPLIESGSPQSLDCPAFSFRRRLRRYHPGRALRDRAHSPDRRHFLPVLFGSRGQRLFPAARAACGPHVQAHRLVGPRGDTNGARVCL
jgi:ferrous iron transport protein B